MKKIIVYGLALSMSLSIVGCSTKDKEDVLVNEPEAKIQVELDLDELKEEEIISLVEEFGNRLKNVSLLAPRENLEKSMEENYGKYVVPELIDKWLNNLEEAPGKLVSSPWPDRIELLNLEKLSDTEYLVEGNIVEVTSVEGEEVRRAIRLNVKNQDDSWLIHDLELGEYE